MNNCIYINVLVFTSSSEISIMWSIFTCIYKTLCKDFVQILVFLKDWMNIAMTNGLALFKIEYRHERTMSF